MISKIRLGYILECVGLLIIVISMLSDLWIGIRWTSIIIIIGFVMFVIGIILTRGACQ